MTIRTGFEIREGSRMLAARRAEREHCERVAAAIMERARRRRIAALAREALRLLDEEGP